MKTEIAAVLTVVAVLAAPAYADEPESVDCFYESNRTQAACAIEASPSTRIAGASTPLLVAYAQAARAEESVDCFYDINKTNPACR